ncbi:MAG: hypothetical protein ABIS18_03885 [Actinomycetota bacterium]
MSDFGEAVASGEKIPIVTEHGGPDADELRVPPPVRRAMTKERRERLITALAHLISAELEREYGCRQVVSDLPKVFDNDSFREAS